MYVWNNTYDGAPIGVTVRSGHECLFELGRDYFYHAPPGYVPYPYPHPLLASILPADAGAGDAAVPTDADATDAAPTTDASATDAGPDASATDAAPTADASATDAAPSVDADVTGDAVVPGNAAPAEESGCDCVVAHSSGGRVPAYLSVLLAILAVGRRRNPRLPSRGAALSLES